MSASYQAKDSGVRARQLKVQSLAIPFTVASNATPASKSLTNDEPTLLFLKLEGINNITVASGALETGETLPTLATATDSTGVFNALVKINELLVKVVSISLVLRDSSGTIKSCEPLAFTTGSTNSGQSVVMNVRSGVNLSSASLDASLEVKYVAAE